MCNKTRVEEFTASLIDADEYMLAAEPHELAAAFGVTMGLAARIARRMAECVTELVVESKLRAEQCDGARRGAEHVASQCLQLGNGSIQWCRILGTHVEHLARQQALMALGSTGWSVAVVKGDKDAVRRSRP